MRTRAAVLETAILGILDQAPMHGYELRKRLNITLGAFRALSYGSLYPALRSLVTRGLIVPAQPATAVQRAGKRSRIVYELTARGSDHLHDLLAHSGPMDWEDESFDVRFALFAQTAIETRIRVLEGRRARLVERLDLFRESTTRTRERLDEYTLELQRHGIDQAEREVRWLDGLIATERSRIATRATIANPLPPRPAS